MSVITTLPCESYYYGILSVLMLVGVTLSECSIFYIFRFRSLFDRKNHDTAECVEFAWQALSCSNNKPSCSICIQKTFYLGKQ